ncbi:MAG: ABC transporter permease [Acetatifactor sp.]|nr:ABC transporter permease [Acetatifactor sp.]
MNRLLSAGFTRLWKNKFFWLGMILLPGFLAFALFSNYYDMKQYNFSFTLDGFLYGSFLLIGMFTSIFAALFLGTEYSDGTIRNKLVIGHSRTSVYLSSLAVCFVSSLLVCLTTIIITYSLGIPLFGTPETPVLTIVQEYAFGVLIIAALSGLFTLLAMMITSKSVSAIVCTVGIFALLFVSMYILQRLLAPEIIQYGYDVAADGSVIPLERPNPQYLTGTARKVYEFFQDFLPTGQGLQLAEFGYLQHPLQACLCSLFVTAATTAGGILAFQKKNLK